MMREERRRWPLLLAGALAAGAGLTLLLLRSDDLHRAILEPAIGMAHDVQEALSVLPQAVLWGIGLLIGAAALVASWKATLDADRTAPERRRSDPARPSSMNAVAAIARDLDRASRHRISRIRIGRELSLLAVRLIARQEGMALPEARELLRSGQWPDDERLRPLLSPRRTKKGKLPKRQFLEAVSSTLSFFDRYHQEV